MNFKALLPLIIFLALGAAFAIGLRKDPSVLPSALIDRPFPEFELPDLFAPENTFGNADLKGQVTLVNVFGSWCVACVQEHPKLMELTRKGSVEIWGVDWRDTQENGRRWLAQYGNPYSRVVFDAESSLAIDLGVTGAPESFLVDKKGQIRYKHVGIIDDKVWADILQPLVRVLEAET